MSYKARLIVKHKCEDKLLNPWGLVVQNSVTCFFKPEIWVANNGSGTVSHYSLTGEELPYSGLVVPSPLLGGTGTPTGLIYNVNGKIVVPGTSFVATLITVTEDGLICVWNPAVNPGNFVTVYTALDGAVYTGATIIDDVLYVTDFKNRKIDTFSTDFSLIDPVSYPFTSLLFETFLLSPYNIKAYLGLLYVTYIPKKQEEPVKGPAFGLVDVFDKYGVFVRRLINLGLTANKLNVPWGITEFAPHFSKYADKALMFGNFGDGQMHIYDKISGELLETIRNRKDEAISIPGLWSLENFGNKVFFTAGGFDQDTGAIGYIEHDDKHC